MGSTDLERQRRHRAHKRGNHSLCHPDRCEALGGPAAAPKPASDQRVHVTPVTRDTAEPDALLISPSLTAALDDAPLLPRDAAAIALVARYAALLDDGDPETVAAIGPKLLRALESLGMTPAGRGVKGGPGAAPAATKLDELRARRASRAERARAD